jgi:hypothetical protein
MAAMAEGNAQNRVSGEMGLLWEKSRAMWVTSEQDNLLGL